VGRGIHHDPVYYDVKQEKGKKPPTAKDRKVTISAETTRYLIENMQLD
jgi:hypothetical protein